MKTRIAGFAAALFAANLLFILLITAVEAVCYLTPGIYEREFEKYRVLDEMMAWRGEEMSLENLSAVMDETMAYLRGRRADLVVETEIDGERKEFYNDTEKSHMADVRELFLRGVRGRRAAIAVCLGILLLLAVSGERREMIRVLARGYCRVCLLLAAAAAAAGAYAFIDFNRLFTVFHRIFFRQGNWLFDPRESRMIDVMPEGFFADMALRIALVWLVCVAAFLIPAAVIRHRSRRKL